MRRLIAFLLIVVLSILLVGCISGGSSDYTIQVTGSNGQTFSGSYMGVTSSGNTSKSVDGVVPATYSISGSIVSCSFQKQTQDGILDVQILKNGKIVKESETSADYGVVLLATN